MDVGVEAAQAAEAKNPDLVLEKGEAVYNDIVPLSYAADRALLSALPESEARLIRQMVKKLVDRSAETMSEDEDWLSILSRFGYHASDHSDDAQGVSRQETVAAKRAAE